MWQKSGFKTSSRWHHHRRGNSTEVISQHPKTNCPFISEDGFPFLLLLYIIVALLLMNDRMFLWNCPMKNRCGQQMKVLFPQLPKSVLLIHCWSQKCAQLLENKNTCECDKRTNKHATSVDENTQNILPSAVLDPTIPYSPRKDPTLSRPSKYGEDSFEAGSFTWANTVFEDDVIHDDVRFVPFRFGRRRTRKSRNRVRCTSRAASL